MFGHTLFLWVQRRQPTDFSLERLIEIIEAALQMQRRFLRAGAL